jgi:hypothetical protein
MSFPLFSGNGECEALHSHTSTGKISSEYELCEAVVIHEDSLLIAL